MNLTKEAIEALFACGFSAQELYDKGLLVPAGDQSAAGNHSAAGDQSAVGDQNAAGDQNAESGQNDEAAAAADADPADAAGESAQIKAMLDAFREEIKTMIQQQNIKDATRQGSDQQKIGLDDAIMNIVKGV